MRGVESRQRKAGHRAGEETTLPVCSARCTSSLQGVRIGGRGRAWRGVVADPPRPARRGRPAQPGLDGITVAPQVSQVPTTTRASMQQHKKLEAT